MKSNLVRVDFRKNDKSEKARYHPSNLKVDVNSLEKCFKAYDMRIEGKTNVEIGAEFLYLDLQIALKDVDLKNKCNVGAYRLIKKAKANIKAAEKGKFGVGHYATIKKICFFNIYKE